MRPAFRILALLVPALLAFSGSAYAYLPPAFFVYAKLAEQKTKNAVSGVALTIARPQAAGTEEILGTFSVSNWKAAEGGWPTLSLIFDTSHEALVSSVTAFGLTVTPEAELMRVDRDKLAAMKDPPRPFYKPDRNMSLKRERQTYAWVHSNAETGRSVWIEKDSFLPLKIAAPCPPAAAGLAWAKAGENKCELEFRNLYALRHGNFQNARLTLWKDGAPLLFFTFDHLAIGKNKIAPSDGKLPAEVKEIAETILH